jgi:hypothetical protein
MDERDCYYAFFRLFSLVFHEIDVMTFVVMTIRIESRKSCGTSKTEDHEFGFLGKLDILEKHK